MAERMRVSAVVREALLNQRGHWLLAAGVFALSIVVGAGIVVLTATEVERIKSRQDDVVARGADMFAVTTVDGNSLSAERCDALNSVIGVLSAGAIVGSDTTESSVSGTRRMQIDLATPGYGPVVWSGLTTDGTDSVTVGRALAEEYGLETGSYAQVGVNVVTVTVPDQVSLRFPNEDSRLVVPMAAKGALTRECLVEAEAGASQSIEVLLTQWFTPFPTVYVAKFAKDLDETAPAAMFSSRLSQFAGIIGAGALLLTMVLSWAIRRSDFALYQLLDRSKRTRLVLASVECAFLVGIPFAVGVEIAILASAEMPELAQVAVGFELLKASMLIAMSPILGYLVASAGGAVKILKQS